MPKRKNVKRKIKKKRPCRFPLLAVGIVAIVLIAILSIALVNLREEGFVEASVIKVVGSDIIIGDNCTAIIATTSPERAYSIQLGIEDKIEERPNTHDSFAEVLKSFNITLESVKLTNFDGRYYYANMVLRAKDKVLKLDIKPSDAIAVAVRLKAPIYVNATLLQEIGKNIC